MLLKKSHLHILGTFIYDIWNGSHVSAAQNTFYHATTLINSLAIVFELLSLQYLSVCLLVNFAFDIRARPSSPEIS